MNCLKGLCLRPTQNGHIVPHNLTRKGPREFVPPGSFFVVPSGIRPGLAGVFQLSAPFLEVSGRGEGDMGELQNQWHKCRVFVGMKTLPIRNRRSGRFRARSVFLLPDARRGYRGGAERAEIEVQANPTSTPPIRRTMECGDAALYGKAPAQGRRGHRPLPHRFARPPYSRTGGPGNGSSCSSQRFSLPPAAAHKVNCPEGAREATLEGSLLSRQKRTGGGSPAGSLRPRAVPGGKGNVRTTLPKRGNPH